MFVPEALFAALLQLEREFHAAMADPSFTAELSGLLADYTGRPSPITEARRFAEHATGSADKPLIVLKREDLNHTGSHKINNVLGQALLTRRMGKTRVIAETGAGQHGVATATAAALFGLDCTVYMGKVDTERQALNVARMRLLGAEVIAVESGTQTLKDAMNDAMRDWVASVDNTHYLIGTVAGPHPFPLLVREFQRVISVEARAQLLDRYGRLPDAVAACVGGGSNALGIFAEFIDDPEVGLYGFEAGGDGVEPGRHAATITAGSSRRAARHADLRAAGRGRPDPRVALHLGWAGLSRRRAGALVAGRRSAGRTTSRSPTPRRWRPSGCCPAPRASCPRSSPPTRWPARSSCGPEIAGPSRRRAAADPGQPLRPRRQGRRHRHQVVRPGHFRARSGVRPGDRRHSGVPQVDLEMGGPSTGAGEEL